MLDRAAERNLSAGEAWPGSPMAWGSYRGVVGLLTMRHCPCFWATERISVTHCGFHVVWELNALWLCSSQEAALGIASWEGCVYVTWMSGEKAAQRRVGAVSVVGARAVT